MSSAFHTSRIETSANGAMAEVSGRACSTCCRAKGQRNRGYIALRTWQARNDVAGQDGWGARTPSFLALATMLCEMP